MLGVAALGNSETLRRFRWLGVDVFPVSGEDEARQAFSTLTNQEKKYAILYVEENYADSLSQEINGCNGTSVILIPGSRQSA